MLNLSALKHYSLVLLTTLLLNSPLAHSLAIGLQPNEIIAGTGEQVSLDLNVSGLGAGGPDSLGAFDVSVDFDPSVFSFTGYSLGNSLGDLALFEAIDASGGDTGGAVNLAEVSLLSAASLDALQASEFILATLIFNVLDLAVGFATELSIVSGPLLVDATGSALPVSDTISAIVENREAVPLPGTPLLLLIALCGWSVTRRLRSAEQ